MQLKQLAIAAGALLALPAACRADHTILAPRGDTTPPDSLTGEFAIGADRKYTSLSSLAVATRQGVEIETRRFGAASNFGSRVSLNAAYPLTADIGVIPAISVGIRDVFSTGIEHAGLYAAVTRSLPLSPGQLRFTRTAHISIGAGSSRIGGLFAGLDTEFKNGVRLSAEAYRRRANFSIAIPLRRHIDLRAYSLNGTVLVGLSLYSSR